MSPGTIRLLLVEDNPGDARYVGEVLKDTPGMEIQQVERLSECLDALEKNTIDVVLLDLGLPDSQGLDTLREVVQTAPRVPVVVFTGYDDRETGQQAVREGAQEYLVKGHAREHPLGRIIRHAIQRGEAKRALLESELELALTLDATTGGIWKWEIEENRMEFSTRYYTMLGYRPGEFPASVESRFELMHPDDRPLARSRLEEFLGSGLDHLESEFRMRAKDGSYRWIRASASVVKRDQRGRALRLIGNHQDVTEREQARQALQRSEESLKRAQRVARVGNWTWHIKSNRLEWSDQMYRIFGISKENFSGDLNEVMTRSIHPDDREAVQASNTSVAEQGKPIPLEYRVILPDGRVRTVWAEAGELVCDDSGEPAVLSGIVMDITERKRAHRETEALLQATRAVLEQPDFQSAARTILDICAGHIGAKAGHFALLAKGREREELLVTAFEGSSGVLDPSLVIPVQGPWKAVCSQPGSVVIDNQFASSQSGQPMPDGHPELENILLAPLILDDRPVGLIGLANKPGGFSEHDGQMAESFGEVAAIALRDHRTREALRVSEEKHRALFDGTADAITTLEPPTWKFTSANPAAIELFGAGDQAEFCTRTPWECSPDTQPDGRSSREVALEMIEAAMQKGSHFFEWEHRTWDARDFPAAVLLTRMRIGERHVLQASIRDLTEQRALQSQVAQSDRLASMGMLAAGVAHEINNPLAYILYNLGSLEQDLPGTLKAMRRFQKRLEEELGPDTVEKIAGDLWEKMNPAALLDVQERFADALEGTRRIREITRSLSTFSRVEKNQLAPVQLTQVIDVAVNMAYNEMKYRARVVKDFGRVPPVMASEGRLSQVFLNLLINAAHAIDEGDVDGNQIRVRTWQENGQACAEVADTGRGIDPAHLDRLFEPFFTTKKIGAGSGLGLAISRNIVEAYGGTIQVESTVGQGTRFTVRLPIQDGEAPADEPLPPESPPGEEARGRVLIVDDEAGIRSSIARMLRNHETVQADSGAAAKQILEQDQAFDVILCDMMMPDMSGMDLHAWIEQENPRLARQLVFITGGAFTPRAREHLSRVDNLRIEKPFDVASLKKTVTDLIRKRRQGC